MDKDRRALLGKLIRGGVLMFVLPLVPGRSRGSAAEGDRYVFVVDTGTCIGCGKCVKACKQENLVPDGFYRTWVERYTILPDERVVVDSPEGALHGFEEQQYAEEEVARSFFVPKLCNHCREPNCVQVCPVGATYKTEEGFVLVDGRHCVGCSYCVQACPYGARFINPGSHTADKCTWCYHRVKQGYTTACVTVCPTGARRFGLLGAAEQDEVARLVRQGRLQVLKPETGNQPMVLYAGLDREVR